MYQNSVPFVTFRMKGEKEKKLVCFGQMIVPDGQHIAAQFLTLSSAGIWVAVDCM